MKIAAIVVTCNRLKLLVSCIEHLRSQTRPLDAIVVVNNGSTDETSAYLNSQTDLIIITQSNRGSAGGQEAGVKFAYENGFDWVWLMDDDFFVQPNALASLVEAVSIGGDDHGYGSVAVSNQNSDELCWHTSLKSSSNQWMHCRRYSEFPTHKICETNAIGFLGIFISKKIIKAIGYPEPRLFLWADDVEYFLRITQIGGFRMFYARESIGTHPPAMHIERKFLWKTLRHVTAPPSKVFYGIRNSTYILRRYRGGILFWAWRLPRRILAVAVVALYVEPDLKLHRFRLYMIAIWNGVIGRLGKHEYT
jgi:rhamnopyranosyl-N-acetylglucosaminyl-diphospho-decaprenol beta-1,3/1,4-galactofuranosyltransferase